MYRSRLKRCQPLLPSNETNPLKKSFVAPRALSTDSSNSEEKKGNDKMEKKTIPVTTQSTLEKKKVFVSPYHRPSQSNEIKDNATNNATSNATSNANGSDNLASYCFSVMYYKSGPKKKKTYLDGILFIEKKSFSLFDPSGKLVKKSFETYNPSEFVQGCTIDLGMWELEIGNTLPISDYTSGRVFLPTAQPETKPVQLSKSPSLTKHFTLHSNQSQKTSTTPKTYSGLYKKTEGSFIIQDSFLDKQGHTTAPVILDPSLNTRMQPHQKEGLLFLYRCINGLSCQGNGCILADEMGLGKTLTTISLIYTCLTQSPWVTPLITSAVVTCPSSLVENWGMEFKKWLGSDKIRCIMINEKGSKAEEKVNDFCKQSSIKRTVLIISYEMYRKYAELINHSHAGLLVCDEGHRLKSSTGNATINCLLQFPSKRRVLISGTPIQNDMEELYALSEFVNPGIFNSLSSFRQLFVKPIEAGRKKGCSASEKELATMRSAELSRITEQFIIRRTTSVLLNTSLPPKITYYLFTSLSTTQYDQYDQLIQLQKQSLGMNSLDGSTDTLSFLHNLRLLCIHPSFIENSTEAISVTSLHEESPKLASIIQIITSILSTTSELILVISSYTQILDFFGKICELQHWGYFRLDGSTDVSKRQTMVNSFNSHLSNNRLFLLSAKAGGVGLNITGASRIIMIEPAWNPAIDSQSIARAWRFGQTQTVIVYRFFISGSLEEVILQRQLVKKDISDITVDHTQIKEGTLSREELKELFTLKKSNCATFDLIYKKKKDDDVWKPFDKEREWKDPIMNANKGLFQYVAEEEISSNMDIKKEKIENEFDNLEIQEDDFL